MIHKQHLRRRVSRPPRGLGALAAVIVLVLLSALAAAVVRLSWASQTGIGLDVMSTRALWAANSGAEWGLFQAFKGSWTTCSNVSQTLDLTADTGFIVTVTCKSSVYNEGQDSSGAPVVVRIYTISAVACNGSGTCPDNTNATRATYVERERLVQATN